ncbi:hypothetical protein CDL15_Pgr025357 [Punica granatum]|uniref:Uncharacterized protein n=2 Tax=Punica granatum TaxID=22663 RepID=A0A218W9Z2_PUNGR|nr:hypothetical protein CDL15_Pgr025357 [Punica granatum]
MWAKCLAWHEEKRLHIAHQSRLPNAEDGQKATGRFRIFKRSVCLEESITTLGECMLRPRYTSERIGIARWDEEETRYAEKTRLLSVLH